MRSEKRTKKVSKNKVREGEQYGKRTDQIWFVQKDELGHSELCALSDFKVRSDASFEKDYLAGVYGGIPFLKEFSLKEGE